MGAHCTDKHTHTHAREFMCSVCFGSLRIVGLPRLFVIHSPHFVRPQRLWTACTLCISAATYPSTAWLRCEDSTPVELLVTVVISVSVSLFHRIHLEICLALLPSRWLHTKCDILQSTTSYTKDCLRLKSFRLKQSEVPFSQSLLCIPSVLDSENKTVCLVDSRAPGSNLW